MEGSRMEGKRQKEVEWKEEENTGEGRIRKGGNEEQVVCAGGWDATTAMVNVNLELDDSPPEGKAHAHTRIFEHFY